MPPVFLTFITLTRLLIRTLPNNGCTTIITGPLNATQPWVYATSTITATILPTAADCAAPTASVIASISGVPSNETSPWPTATAYINGSHSASCYYVPSSAISSTPATVRTVSYAPNVTVFVAGPSQTGGCGNSSYIAGTADIPNVSGATFTVATGPGATAFAFNESDATSYTSSPAVTSISGGVGADGTLTASAVVTTMISFCDGPIMTYVGWCKGNG